MLACLVRERLVRRLPDRHYAPGPLLFEMGLALTPYAALQAACAPVLEHLAQRTSGQALLCVRSGVDTVCIGAAGVPAYLGTAFEVGTRRPLTATAAGVAILVALPREAARRIVEGDAGPSVSGDEPKRDALQKMWRRSEGLGYAVNQGFTARGVNAVGVPLRDAGGAAFGSLTIAGPAASVPAVRIPSVAAMLAQEAAGIEALARELLPEGTYNEALEHQEAR